MNAVLYSRFRLVGVLALLICCVRPGTIQAQLMLSSSIPVNGATGVSPAAPVIFTFNMAADQSSIFVLFTDGGAAFFNTETTWNAASTIMTNTPVPPFPNNTNIQWQVFDGSVGTLLGTGSFSTGTGSGGGGSGTNRITTFSLSKGFLYDQTSTAAPVLDSVTPYTFVAGTILASNRTATSITLTLPNAAVSNLTQNPVAHENYFLAAFYTNFITFSNSWPDGAYTFRVFSNATMQTVPVTLPASMVQPNAPHVSNYAAAQTVNPSQPFTLTWDMFTGGTTTDYVFVTIGNFTTANPANGTNGVLTGTATSVLIPANTFQTNSTFDGILSFYRATYTTNAAGYATFADKVSSTQFILTTGSGGTTGPLKLISPAFVSGTFNFSVTSGISQTFTVEYKTNSAGSSSWQTLVTTSSPSGNVRLADPHSISNRFSLYRARNGP